jgi:hypothetical protein
MSGFFKNRSRALLTLIAATALAVSACGGSSAATNSGAAANNGAGAASNSVATSNTGAANNGGGGGLSDASAAFSNITSYQFNMTLAGGTFSSLVSTLGGSGASGGSAMTVTGTVIVKPQKAADVTVGGIHIIDIGGYSYMDLGTGQFIKSKSTGTSMADSFAPTTMFSSAVDASTADGYSKVGSENKNGVSTDHYQASTTALAEYGSMLSSQLGGASNVTWSADVWIANSGSFAGCPVSMVILAKTADGKAAYEVSFDISKINDPGNKVTAPTNVMGG